MAGLTGDQTKGLMDVAESPKKRRARRCNAIGGTASRASTLIRSGDTCVENCLASVRSHTHGECRQEDYSASAPLKRPKVLRTRGVFSDSTGMMHRQSAGALGKIKPCLCHGEQASFLIEPAAGFRELEAGRRQPSVLLVLTHGVRPQRINLHY